MRNVSFRETQIEEFALPDEKERGAEKILSLAEQPLLLLMLALYDSQDVVYRQNGHHFGRPVGTT